MNRVKLLKVFITTVLMAGLWVISVIVYLFSRQEVIPIVTPLQYQLKPEGRTSELLASRRVTDHSTEVFELEYIFQGLNKHSWEMHCQSSIKQLCNFPIFPKAPDKRNFVQNVNINSKVDKVDGAVRLLGYVRPNASGEYQFLVTSNGLAQVWLSPSTNWKDAKKIANIEPGPLLKKLPPRPMKSEISSSVSLIAGHRHFFEVIYVKTDRKSSKQLIEVAWKRRDRTEFELIEREFFSLYTVDSDKAKLKIYDENLPDVLACEKLRRRFANKYMRPETLPYLSREAVDKTLPICEYKPSYLLDPANLPRDFKTYHGVRRHVHKTHVYPVEYVGGVVTNQRDGKWILRGPEYPLNETESLIVVHKYFHEMDRMYLQKYELKSIKRVEKKDDYRHGSRYLLELVVRDVIDDANYILAEYVFQPRGKNDSLCYPKGLQWDRTADVYFVLTAKNLGRWIHHFIKNVEQVVQETNDEHLHVVIFDFDSPDIDLEQAFKRSTLKNYHFITQPGNYSRTVSFSKAIESIKNPDAIIVTIDMHLDIGSQLINDIRKHCIKGRTLYAPQIIRLSCDGSSASPNGHWFYYSYGTIAVYKEDWEKFGGFSTRFGNKVTWGGEDWDIIDGAVKGGLEIERKRSPAVYHYYHTKAGMWQKAKRTTKRSTGKKKT